MYVSNIYGKLSKNAISLLGVIIELEPNVILFWIKIQVEGSVKSAIFISVLIVLCR